MPLRRILIASLAGMLVSARSLQIGPAVAVIAVTSVAANATTIAAGPVVFGDPLPDDAVGVAARICAFALVIAAAVWFPQAPVSSLPPLDYSLGVDSQPQPGVPAGPAIALRQ